jgi:1-acyl-sn-glycerol-3-phosphate acyltransferase
MRRYFFWPYQLYVWLLFVPLVLVLTLLASTLSVLAAITIDPNWASRNIAARWARLLARLTPILVEIEGADHARPGQSYVVVANHQSQYDILLLYGWLNLDLKWVMKQEIRKIPGIGIGCEKVGHIFVDRKRPAPAASTVAPTVPPVVSTPPAQQTSIEIFANTLISTPTSMHTDAASQRTPPGAAGDQA